MKRIISVLLVFVILCSTFTGLQIVSSGAELPSSGSCGKNVTYTFDTSTGVVVISGSGAMTSYYNSNGSPFYNKTSIKTVVINSGVTSIGGRAFYDCSGLTSITIPNSVTHINDWAFSGCSGLTKVNITDLSSWCKISFGSYYANPLSYAHNLYLNNVLITDLVIPDNVTTIKTCTFFCCSRLTSITIPNSVTSIGSSAFHGCKGLTSITIPNSVTSIGDGAFKYCSSLTSVTICNSVTSIGSYAFSGCGLTSVTIPDSVTSIGNSAFSGCSSLTSITIPNSVKSLGNHVFEGCTGLTSITIPDSVTSIGSSAFSNCSGLTSIDIPSSVTSIGASAFCGCSGLTSIDIPDSITSINGGVFEYCSSLTNVIIPDSVIRIENYAFEGCSGLTNITIPDSVTSIGYYAFSGCNDLKIHGSYGSAAHRYAKQNGLEFIGPEHEHQYTSQITRQSTCNVAGEKKFTCSICGDYYTEELPKLAHDYYFRIIKQPTCTTTGTKMYACNVCSYYYTETIPKTAHSYVSANIITKASQGADGRIVKSKCSYCGLINSSETIYAPNEIVLSTSTYTYSGKANKPAVTVKDRLGKVIGTSNYTVTYSNNVNVGTAKATVNFNSSYYTGSMSANYKITAKKLTTCGIDSTFTYTGKAIVPVPYYYKSVTYTDYYGEKYTVKERRNFKKGTDYTIAVSGGHKNVGKYTVVVKFKGIYSGTVKKTFEIRPRPVAKSSAVAYSTSSIKVSWKKVAGVSGYSIYRWNDQIGKYVKYKNTTSTSMIVPRVSAKDLFVEVEIFTYKKVGNKVYYNQGSKTCFDRGYTKPSKPIIKLSHGDFGEFKIKFNRYAGHQIQISDNKAFSNKGNHFRTTVKSFCSAFSVTQAGSTNKYYVRAREYYYDDNTKLFVGPWSDVKSITTY